MIQDALNFSDGKTAYLRQAREAVKRELFHSGRWVKVRGDSVIHEYGEEQQVWRLSYTGNIRRDFNFDGARVFQPIEDDPDPDPEILWEAEIVEVDQRNQCLFVLQNADDPSPEEGTWYLEPYPFLLPLYRILSAERFEDFEEVLTSRLREALSPEYPECDQPVSNPGIAAFDTLWKHKIGMLWGPPGTGKTYNLSRQTADVIDQTGERILILSTTNKATDECALNVGEFLRERGWSDLWEIARRTGKGSNYKEFEERDLEGILPPARQKLRSEIDVLKDRLRYTKSKKIRAWLKARIKTLRERLQNETVDAMLDSSLKAVITTVYGGMYALANSRTIQKEIRNGRPPFSTVIIDEASLIPRAAVAALSLFASRRVVLAGDPYQLSPIAQTKDLLPPEKGRWIAKSAMSVLDLNDSPKGSVQFLTEQYRMHPEIREVISEYRYEGEIEDSQRVKDRAQDYGPPVPARAIVYPLDEDVEADGVSSVQARRGGPTGDSWVRPFTPEHILDKFFDSNPQLQNGDGLFVTPFVGQVELVNQYFANHNMDSWRADTVHSQQGKEADYVIFDTVNARSNGWETAEWKRLINVGMSRARQFVCLLASIDELCEPALKGLPKPLDTVIFEEE